MRINKEKTLSTGASPAARTAEHVYQTVRTLDMTNLRPCHDCNLRPVGRPKLYSSMEGAGFLGIIDGSIVAARGSEIISAPLEQENGLSPVFTGSLPSSPLCTLSHNGELTVMTAAGATGIGHSGSKSAISLDADFPPLTLLPSTWGKTSATVASRTLSQVYNTATPITSRDASAVTGDLAAAYLRMCADAAAVGGMIQPVLARYKLRDSRGNLLFTSAPVLLGHSNGAQLAEYTGLKSDDRKTLRAYTLEADLWSLSVKLPDASKYSNADRVAQAEIWMTPMFHPYHPDMQGTAVITRNSSATDDFLRITLPGMNCGLGNGRLGNVERLVMKALAHIDNLEERVAVIPVPFEGGARTVAVALSPNPDAASESRNLSKNLAKAVEAYTPARVLLSAPHTFSATCCAADSSTAVWGNLTVKRYAGYPLQSMAVGFSDEAWTATTVVRFADGSAVSRTESGTTGAPMAFSPLLTYPSPDAVEMKIIVSSGGKTRTHTIQLRPDATCRVSAFAGAGATPLSLVEVSGVTVPAVAAPVDRFRGALAFAPADNPLAIENVTETGGTIHSLIARVSPDQSWEFGRSRFLAGTENGVYSVAVAPGRSSLSVRRVADGKVSRRDAMVQAATGDIFVLCGADTGSGPSLLRIPPSGRPTLFEVPRDYRCLAWSDAAGELWAIRSDGSADIFCLAHDWRRYSRNDISVNEVYNTGDEIFGASESGLLRLGAEEAVAQHVGLAFLVNPDKLRPVRPGCLQAILCCSSLFGTLTLEGRNFAGGRPWQLLSVTLDGACMGPLSVLPVGRPLRRMELRFDADVAPDFVFDSFKIGYYDHRNTTAA